VRPRRRGDKYLDSTHQPLHCLVFLLPAVVLYELGAFWTSPAHDSRVAAWALMHHFFELFGATSLHLPALAVVIIFLVLHATSGEPWRVQKRTLVGMAAESAVLALPLRLLGRLMSPTVLFSVRQWVSDAVLSVGAGIYEELVFRLILISLGCLILIDILRLPVTGSLIFAVMVSSGLFAAHHYVPFGRDTFNPVSFAFRAAAGIYLAAIFVMRGFGIAAGCHIIYDLIVVTLNGMYIDAPR
jgi:hypothetical protein